MTLENMASRYVYCFFISNIESISGKFMMNVLFMMMMKSDLLKIMVSVFKTNAIAMKFF